MDGQYCDRRSQAGPSYTQPLTPQHSAHTFMRVQRSLPRLSGGLRWTHVSAIAAIVTAIVCFWRLQLGGTLLRVSETQPLTPTRACT
jgi:hypothetical protein